MATSAFKSTSRRSTSSTSSAAAATKSVQSAKQKGTGDSTQKAPIRRSRSVSAFSRTQLDLSLDFQNKTDNPLFWVDGSPRSEEESNIKFAKFDKISLKSVDPSSVKSSNGGGNGVESGRGRTVSRNSRGDERRFSFASTGCRRDLGRSLSRVDTGQRRRSPSRGRPGNFEREEQERGVLSDVRSRSKISSNSNCSVPGEKNKLVRSASDLSEVLKSWNTWSSQHRVLDTADDSPRSMYGSRLRHWDDVGSTGSVSEEEKTIIPVLEVKKANHLTGKYTNVEILRTGRTGIGRGTNMQDDLKSTLLRTNSEIDASKNLSDIVPEVVNHNAEELLRDFRGDFARELEECEERTRKLQGELAVEEHRELELNKILNDIQEPKTPQVQKPRAARKASMERRKVSKRLEEEAMAYFDECVSISTFDESELSSLEDLPSITTIADVACPSQSQDLSQSWLVQCTEDSGFPSTVSCNDTSNRSTLSSSKVKPQYPIKTNPSVPVSLEQDIRNYVKNFSKNSKRESSNARISGTGSQNVECTSLGPVEEILLDRVIFRSRIESGRMLLCGGCSGLPGIPFASVL